MSSNYVVSVPKLKGRENYAEWAFAAENFLVLEGTSDCILETKPEEAAADAKTRAKLILTIDSSLYVHIKEVKSTKELWDKLKQLFDDSGFTRRISLLRTLISIRLENCTSMTSYVTQIIETSQKLSGTGFKINDEWVGSLLLAGLSEKYSPMIMAIEHSGIQITADAIKTKLMDLEEVSGDVSGAFASFRKNKVGSTGGTKDNMSKSKPKIIKCYRCKQTGHYRNQCTNIEKDTSNTKTIERKQTNAFSAVFLDGVFAKNDWYVDSGASAHLTANENWIKNASTEHPIKEIVVANKEKVAVKCSGDVQIATLTDDCEYDVVVEEVLCVPSLTTNLLSVSQLIARGNRVYFTSDGCQIYNKADKLVATACLINGVYKLKMPERFLAAVMTSSDMWHRRLGHLNSNYLNKMENAVEGLTLDRRADISKSSCIVCCEGKQSRLPFPQDGSRSDDLLQLVHSDICGPFSNVSIGGSRYYILFVDDYSRMIYIYFLKNKSEALDCFKVYKTVVENQLNKKIKKLRTDNGKEYCSKEFEKYLSNSGIIHQKSNPYTPEQNGLAERCNRSVVEKARCLLFDAGLDNSFWAEAANTAVYLQNRTVASALNGKTPYEMWTSRKPDISHLRVFGSIVMMHIPKEKRLKWDKKAEKGILVGYPEDVKGYRIYIPKTKVITTSRDVIIIEKPTQVENPVQIQEPQSQTESSEVHLDSVGDISDDTESEEYHDGDETYVPDEEEISSSSCESVVSVVEKRECVRRRQRPDRYGFSNVCFESDSTIDVSELSLQDALNGPEREQWLEAVRDELQCFEDNNAWELSEVPNNNTIVQCRWVLRKKYDSENKVRFRARLVAKGFSQKRGVDYTETFSPVVRHTTLRLLFSLSVQLGLDVTHLDVKTAFLNGDLEETIYMQIPDCFDSPGSKNKVLKLKKAIYGLKQASRAWNKKLDNCLLECGYKKSKLEPCVRVASWLEPLTVFNFLTNIRQVDWGGWRRDTHNLFTKLIRTKDPRESEQTQEVTLPSRQRLSRCLTTMDLTSLGVGSCVGTGMYLVAGMVARKFAGPGVVISFIIAALASIFSGACYAEFGVRVPNTTGSAYMYSYVTVGEFIAFVIGWNMILEYLIGSSACARALSACFDSLFDGAISRILASKIGTMFGKPPDVLAAAITLMMMLVLVAGVRKSLFFNNLLNAINLSIWVFIMAAGLFYIDTDNWTDHKGFLPYGWSGVFTGAATCFYAFIGFDIIATTGEEANNPKRSIPLAIVNSLGIILLAYVSTSMMLTLIVPYDQVDTDSALVQMFAHVNAPTCKYIVAIGALAGLTVSMFGSMFPMPRVVYAMALDGLIFKKLAAISPTTGTPAFATICGGIAASVVALFVQLEVLVEMMSIGTLLAYTLVSTCVLVLRYQPHSTNLIELLPQSLRTPVDPEGTASANRETTFTAHATTHIMPPSQRVMVRRVTRSSPDSDDTLPGDESEEYRDDTFLVHSNNENNYYVGGGSSGSSSACSRFLDALYRQLHSMSYLCPGLFPWVDLGPATDMSGMLVIKSVGIMYVLIIVFDLFAAYGNPGSSTFTNVCMILLILAIFSILLMISRKPQNRVALIYTTPGLPFVPTIAIIVNIYLILNLSILTLVRFTVWMIFGMFMYFKYGIKNSTLETNPPVPTPETPPPPNPLDRTTIPPPPPYQPPGDRNIFEGDGNEGLYGNMEYDNPLLTWHESNLQPVGSGFSTPSSESNRMQTQAQPTSSNQSTFRQAEAHFDPRTNRTTTVTSSISRPPWAYPDAVFPPSWE